MPVVLTLSLLTQRLETWPPREAARHSFNWAGLLLLIAYRDAGTIASNVVLEQLWLRTRVHWAALMHLVDMRCRAEIGAADWRALTFGERLWTMMHSPSSSWPPLVSIAITQFSDVVIAAHQEAVRIYPDAVGSCVFCTGR